MARSEAVRRRRRRGASSNLSRTTSDFEIFPPRDSASMSATRGSGRRTVRVFMHLIVFHLWRVSQQQRPICLTYLLPLPPSPPPTLLPHHPAHPSHLPP